MFARKFNVSPKSADARSKIGKMLDIIDIWRADIRTSPKMKLLENYKVIKIEMNGECLTFDDRQNELIMDWCFENDEMQIFILVCTDIVDIKYGADGQCLQSVSQFGGLAMSQCQIRSVVWDRRRHVRDCVARDECLSVREPAPKIKEAFQFNDGKM